ncbi:predicted protein [Nematostella vectensis]|uniref:Spermatogenesis-associated serine-rich protein 2 n=1 Tax=Nematostella vectensis TaxID=45351 RepID=A7RHN2_NEMVE|nr:predicted protein [Nematostella vectensis]|eukprot:XP_001641070.1 predicted protein [Nematostella vectensis]
MSAKSNSSKLHSRILDCENGHVFADISRQQNGENVKSKVDFVYGAVSSRSKNDILLVLQSVDYNVEAAISIFSRGEDEEVLQTWSFQGKKNKNGSSKKKRNKKKLNNKEASKEETTKEGQANYFDDSSLSNGATSSQAQDETESTENLLLDLKSTEAVASLAPPSPSSSETSGLSDLIASHDEFQSSPEHTAKLHPSSAQHKNAKKYVSKPEQPVTPNNSHHHETLKKTIKDLSRSTFSLARYNVILEEECESSLKRISSTFNTLRKCLCEREAALVKELEEFKVQSVHLLEERLEDASALKLKAERAGTMGDEQVVLLRADIKSFVGQRKLDEELAQTTRFVCDEEEMLKVINTYGQVVPIKHNYTPAVLNHVNTLPQPHNKISNTPKPPIELPTPASITSSQTAHNTTTLIDTTTSPTSTTSTASTTTANAIRVEEPPKSSFLQETAEMHVRLKQALKKQGVEKPSDSKGSRASSSSKPWSKPHESDHSQNKSHHIKPALPMDNKAPYVHPNTKQQFQGKPGGEAAREKKDLEKPKRRQRNRRARSAEVSSGTKEAKPSDEGSQDNKVDFRNKLEGDTKRNQESQKKHRGGTHSSEAHNKPKGGTQHNIESQNNPKGGSHRSESNSKTKRGPKRIEESQSKPKRDTEGKEQSQSRPKGDTEGKDESQQKPKGDTGGKEELLDKQKQKEEKQNKQGPRSPRRRPDSQQKDLNNSQRKHDSNSQAQKGSAAGPLVEETPQVEEKPEKAKDGKVEDPLPQRQQNRRRNQNKSGRGSKPPRDNPQHDPQYKGMNGTSNGVDHVTDLNGLDDTDAVKIASTKSSDAKTVVPEIIVNGHHTTTFDEKEVRTDKPLVNGFATELAHEDSIIER